MKKLDKYDYISFDLYDTLLKRNIASPSDIFKLVEKEYNKRNSSNVYNFQQARINAEKECRKNNEYEIKLDDIYEKLSKNYGTQKCIELKKIELELEIALTQKNNDTYINDIYDFALSKKKVIITSDMYLPEKVIKNILKKLNIKYYKIYLSSTIGKRKANGTIFKYILDDLNIETNQIIHIGDNRNSDYLMPKKNNIDSILIRRDAINSRFFYKCLNDNNKLSLDYNIVQSFINNNINPNNNFFRKFGYEVYGPLLFSFCIWLKNQLESNNIQKVYFLARDGKIIKEAFDLFGVKKIRTEYLYASRRSIIVPSLHKCKDINEVFSKIHISSRITIRSLLKKLGLDDFDASQLLEKYNMNIDSIYLFSELRKKYISFFNELFPFIVNNSKQEYYALMKYLNKMEFFGRVAIVDIGWYGNMQNALSSLIDADIYGFYLGLRPDKKKNIITKGFLFDANFNDDLREKEMVSNSIFEFIFSSNDGSVKRFVDTKDMVQFYECENSDEYEKNALNDIQNGALLFINDISESGLSKYLNINAEDSSKNLIYILLHPNLLEATMLGNLKFTDDDTNYIAKPNFSLKNIINPKKVLVDIKKSTWKIGYLKRLFKLALPYDKMYLKIKK